MNRFYLCGIVSFFLLLLSQTMTSCREEEEIVEKQEEKKTPIAYVGKVLVSQVDSHKDTTCFTYDSRGRLQKWTIYTHPSSPSYPSVVSCNLEFGSNSFTGKYRYDQQMANSKKYSYSYSGFINKQGYISSFKTTNDNTHQYTQLEYQYNGIGQLSSYLAIVDSLAFVEYAYTWEDNNIVEYRKDGELVLSYTYSVDDIHLNRGNLRFDGYPDYPDASLGLPNKYLPTTMTEYGNAEPKSYDIEYTFDTNGYPLTMKCNDIFYEYNWKVK